MPFFVAASAAGSEKESQQRWRAWWRKVMICTAELRQISSSEAQAEIEKETEID